MTDIIGGNMKNKIILGAISLLLCVTATACSSSTSTMTKTNLSSQLDKTSNSIATVKSVSTSDIEIDEDKLNSIENEQKCENFKNSMTRAQDTLSAEQFYRDEILYKTAIIKKYLQKEDLKLAKGELNALKDLTANLSNYNDDVARSSNEFNATYRNYNTMKKSALRNIDRVNAKLNKITCNSNTRCSYYINILNTLQSMEDILGIDDYDYYNDLKDNILEDTPSESIETPNKNEETIETPSGNGQTNDKLNNQNGKRFFPKNIDTYRNIENNAENINENSGTENNTTPIRNTDTYAPFRRNIDTYRPYGYGYGMYGMNGYGMNGMYNGYGMNGYGNFYNRGINSPYGYNSNNINRLAQPVDSEPAEREMDEDEEKIINEEKMSENIENSRLKDRPKFRMKNIRKIEKPNENATFDNENKVDDLKNNNSANIIMYNSKFTNNNLRADNENNKNLTPDNLKNNNNLKNDKNVIDNINDENTTSDVTKDVDNEKDITENVENDIDKTEDAVDDVANIGKKIENAGEDIENAGENVKDLVDDTKQKVKIFKDEAQDKIKSVSLLKVEEIDDNDERVKAH